MPMFHSQTALAYNPDLTNDVPGSYADLTEWVKKEPKEIRIQGHQGRHVRVAFVTGWVYAFSGNAEQMIKGPYDAATRAAWDGLLGKLKDFNKNVIITPGNAGTLDMLNRGEIAVGPVWVDVFYTWMAEGKLPPSMKLKLIHAWHAGSADVLRGTGEGRQRQARRSIRGAGDKPRGSGRRHHQALQLVSGNRC